LKFALEVWSHDWNETLRTCAAAERLGYDAFYYGESPTGLNLDCWVVLAALARATREIRIGPVIANLLPVYRSLALLARQAASTAILSDGRLDFRTGAGASKRYADPWWEPFGVEYPRYEERLGLLERCVPLLRSLWAGRSVHVDGGDVEVSLGFEHPAIPITIAATGPSGLACAARHADVWEASYRSPAEFVALASRLEVLPGATQRSIGRSLELDVFVGRNAREAAAVVARVKEERGPDRAPQVIERSIRGTPPEIVPQLASLHSAGVEQLVLAFHDPHDVAALEGFAEAMQAFRRG